jgi:hypothetical protein
MRRPEQIHPSSQTSLSLTCKAQIRTRFPHVWIQRDGERFSTLDLFGG